VRVLVATMLAVAALAAVAGPFPLAAQGLEAEVVRVYRNPNAVRVLAAGLEQVDDPATPLPETMVEGLALYDGRELRHVRLAGPPGDDVSSLAWDGDSLWVGYFDGGLARLSEGAWDRVPTPGPPGAAWINALHWDGGTLWVGSEAGLGRWSPGQGVVAQVEAFEGRVQSVRSEGGTLVVTGSERVWIATADGWETLDLPNEALHTAFVRGRVLWAAGMRGILRRDGGKWRRYSELNGRLPDSWVTALLPVGDEIWAGTYDAGLLALPREGEARMLRSDAWVNFNALAKSGDLVAVGTMGDGLLLYEGESRRWRRITMRDGLPSDDVTAVLFAGDTLWVGTRAGLAELKRRDGNGVLFLEEENHDR